MDSNWIELEIFDDASQRFNVIHFDNLAIASENQREVHL